MRTCLALCCRPGIELCGVTWDGIDIDRATARIWMPKVSAEKTVRLPRWWIEEARLVERAPDGFVCRGGRGGRLTAVALKNGWVRACRAAGKTVPAYAVRHIAASRMLAAGVDAAAVAAQLGHRNLATTAAFYIHATDGAQASAALALPAPCDLVRVGAEK